MKVILTRVVKGVGRAHEEVATSDGYALNYLIPKKLAIAATVVAKKEAETRRKQVTDRSALDTALLTPFHFLTDPARALGGKRTAAATSASNITIAKVQPQRSIVAQHAADFTEDSHHGGNVFLG